MPLYRCMVREGSTSQGQRAEIANEIVRVHCAVTGAPPSFVHAFFAEVAKSDLPAGKVAFVLGTIRSGRTNEQKKRIVSELTESIARVTRHTPAEVDVMTADVPAKWTMEGGELLPEPGEEAEWLGQHKSA